MCDYKKGSRIKTGVFFCDRVLVFASHIRYNDRKLFQRERRKTVMKKIVFATGNAGKMKEIREILADLPVEIYSMKEAGISVEIDENGKTFEENAKIKAQTVAGCTDGGTIVLLASVYARDPGRRSGLTAGETYTDWPFVLERRGSGWHVVSSGY